MESDFGHVHVDFPGGRRMVPVLLLTWGHSNRPFAKACPSEKTEAILDGMVEGFDFFGCVPREVWWDNPKTVVSELLTGRERRINPNYAALASHYAFDPLFCMPARGNEKPRVENRVYDLQRRWATPVPQVRDLDELNEHLRQRCLAEFDRTVGTNSETIGQRFEQDLKAASPLPVHPFDPCVCKAAKVDKFQTAAYDTNRYSVPRRYAFETATMKAYVDRIEIVIGGKVVATHQRTYERKQQILDPLHYLVTLGRKPAALDHSNVYRNWQLPACFIELRAELEKRHGPFAGSRQYVRVLQFLAEHPMQRVSQAIIHCLRNDVVNADAIGRRVEWVTVHEKPVPQSLEIINHNPRVKVQVPRANLKRYDLLLQ